MNRLKLSVGGVVAALAIFVLAAMAPARSAAQNTDLEAQGLQAVAAWVETVASGDKEAVAAILAPEFQIVRSNGVAYDRDGYLASELPVITDVPEIDALVATSTGDIMVVRYVLVIEETIDGQPVEARGPRLTVFRRDGDAWLVSAHANFAAIGQ